MRLLFFSIGICWFGVMTALPGLAQDYKQQRQQILQQQDSTRSQIEQIEALINTYQQRLNKAEKRFDELYAQYENLKRLLALQRQKIASLQKERRQINAEIAVTEKKLEQQEEKLETLIEDYKETMRYVYKNGRTSQLALILSSGSLNQMMIRNYYLKKFESFREKQAEEIRQTQAALKESQQQLDQAAGRNEKVLAEIQAEKEKLEQRTREQQTNVNLLSRDRLQLESKIAQTQRQKEQLNNTLSSLINREEEVREAEEERRRREAEQQRQADLAAAEGAEAETEPEADNSTPEETPEATPAASREYVGKVGYVTDAELDDIEAAFSSQKGTLPWPVESTTISEHFGRRRHPIYNTVTQNLGIEIVTDARAPVKVVHDGYVFAVQPIAGYGDVVFVSHGKYKTAYGNLSRVMVRKNTILQKGDLVGYSGDENSTRGKSVFFMLRSGSQNLDPEQWLK